jgi:predicted transcriptional regulator
LNPGIGGTKVVPQEAVPGFVAAKQWLRELETWLCRAVAGRLTERGELEVQVPN